MLRFGLGLVDVVSEKSGLHEGSNLIQWINPLMDLATDGIIGKSWKLPQIGPTWWELVDGSISLMGISYHPNLPLFLHFSAINE